MANVKALVRKQTNAAKKALPVAVGVVGGMGLGGLTTKLVRTHVPKMEPGSAGGKYVAPVVGALVGGGVGQMVASKAYRPAAAGVVPGAVLGAVLDIAQDSFGFKFPGFGLIVAEQGAYLTGPMNGLDVEAGGMGAMDVSQGAFGMFNDPFTPTRM